MENQLKATMERFTAEFEQALKARIGHRAAAPGGIAKMMAYSLLGGGKRLRPFLLFLVCRMFGGDEKTAFSFGCGIEMIHTYSLIHDDLPCMDNDDLRRGKPTSHRAFGECNALLAGDALLTESFSCFTEPHIPAAQAAEAVRAAADYAGCTGMIGGQMLDLAAEKNKPDLSALAKLQALKTGALLRLAGALGCISAGIEKEDKRLFATMQYCDGIGAAFQIIDDILDVIGDETVLGKHVGSDAENHKTTFLSFLSAEDARALAALRSAQACAAIEPYDKDGALRALAALLLTRKK